MLKNKAVMNYLFQPAGYDQVVRVLEKYQIGEERVEEALFICEDILAGKEEITHAPAIVKERFGLTDDVAKQLAADLIGHRLLPLETFIPGIADAITSWGGNIEDYPDIRIQQEEETPEYRVKKMAEAMGLELPEELMDRFTYLATGYLKKTRPKEATAKILKRSFDIGGLDFTDTQVEGFFKALDHVESGDAVGADPSLPAEAPGAKEGVRPLESTGKRTGLPVPESEIPSEAKSEMIPESNSEIVPEKLEDQMPAPVAESLPMVREPEEVMIADDAVGARHAVPVQNENVVGVGSPDPSSQNSANRPGEETSPIRQGAIKTPLASILPTGNNIAKVEEKMVETEKLVVQPARIVEKLDDAVGADPGVRPLESTGKRTGLPVQESEIVPEKKSEFAPEIVFADVDKSVAPAASKSDAVASKKIDAPVGADPGVRPLESTGKRTGLPVPQAPAKKSPAQNEFVPGADPVKNALQPAIEISKKNGIKKKTFDSVVDAHLRGVRDPRQTERMLAEQLKLEGEDLQIMMKALEDAKHLKHGDQPKKNNFLTPAPKTPALAIAQVAEKSVRPEQPVRVSAARTALEEEKLRQQKIVASPIAPSKPPKAPVKLTAPSVPPSDGSVRKVADVKFARTLVGPEEELGSMTITEFRRLSTDPVQASKKIEDKLTLLEEQSYEARVGGIRAWRRSPLYEIYLEMTREALKSGTSLPEVASNRRNLGEETLSPAEIKAIIDLHRRIGF